MNEAEKLRNARLFSDEDVKTVNAAVAALNQFAAAARPVLDNVSKQIRISFPCRTPSRNTVLSLLRR